MSLGRRPPLLVDWVICTGGRLRSECWSVFCLRQPFGAVQIIERHFKQIERSETPNCRDRRDRGIFVWLTRCCVRFAEQSDLLWNATEAENVANFGWKP